MPVATNSRTSAPRITVKSGTEVKRPANIDFWRRYLTNSLKPETLAGYLEDVDNGDIAAMCELQEEMEGKDGHLQGVAARRREAVTGLEWAIEPNETATDEDVAADVADFVQRTLDRIKTWPETLEHLATGIGPGIGVTELIWETKITGWRLVATNDVPGQHLKRAHDSLDVLIETDDQAMGIPTPLGKYIVHTPNSRAGFPLRTVPTRAQAIIYLRQHMALADWANFMEKCGIAPTVALLGENATEADATTVAEWMRDMSSDSYAALRNIEDVKWFTAPQAQPFEAFIEWAERKTSILWLGGNLPTELTDQGSRAAAQVQANVKASILINDIANERRTIEQQVITPIVAMRYPGQVAPVPRFRRTVTDARDVASEQLDLQQLQMAKQLGLPVDRDVMYEKLHLPLPIEQPQEPAPMTETTP